MRVIPARLTGAVGCRTGGTLAIGIDVAAVGAVTGVTEGMDNGEIPVEERGDTTAGTAALVCLGAAALREC